MRKITLFIATSLDGFIAGKNDEINWLFSDQDYGYNEFYNSIDTVLMGRRTYEVCLKLEKEPFKGKEAIVFSSRPKKAYANFTFVQNPIEFAKKLKKTKGKGIWLVGGGKIASLFAQSGLIDELRLFVHPIVLGSGLPLFNLKNGLKLKLLGVEKFSSGLVELRYEFEKNVAEK